MNEQEAKAKFAEELLRRPRAAFEIACELFGPMETGRALKASAEWPVDPYVLDIQAGLIEEHGERYFLPTKEQFARQVIDYADTIRTPEDRLKAYRLYAEVMGFIEKPGVVVNNNVDNRRVMIVKDHGNDDDWERRLVNQQKQLTNAAASRTH